MIQTCLSNSSINPHFTTARRPDLAERLAALSRRVRRHLPPIEAGVTIGWAMASLAAAALAIVALD